MKSTRKDGCRQEAQWLRGAGVYLPRLQGTPDLVAPRPYTLQRGVEFPGGNFECTDSINNVTSYSNQTLVCRKAQDLQARTAIHVHGHCARIKAGFCVAILGAIMTGILHFCYGSSSHRLLSWQCLKRPQSKACCQCPIGGPLCVLKGRFWPDDVRT